MKLRLFNLIAILALVLGGLAATPISSAAQSGGGGFGPSTSGPAMTTAQLLAAIPYMSTSSAAVATKQLGGNAPGDVIVSAIGGLTPENQASIAVNPYNEKIVVVFHQLWLSGTPTCDIDISTDGGTSFQLPIPIIAWAGCINPVVRFSPDGQYVYYVFETASVPAAIGMAIGSGFNPLTMGSAFPVLSGVSSSFDKPWVDVAPYDSAHPGLVMVTATEFTPAVLPATGINCSVGITVSENYGSSWTSHYLYKGFPPAVPAPGTCQGGASAVVTGSRPIGLSGAYKGQAIACWFSGSRKAFINLDPGGGLFNIKCMVNKHVITNPGAWLGTNTAFNAVAGKNEVPLRLGPGIANPFPGGSSSPVPAKVGAYETWHTTMYPSLATDPQGMVYIGYTADPTTNHFDVESGNVYLARNYPKSSGWVTTVVGNNPSGPQLSQGFQAVEARFDSRTNSYVVYVSYMDTLSNNKFYNVVYRRGVRAPSSKTIAFGPKVVVNDLPSWSDFGLGMPYTLPGLFGDYFDSALTQRRYLVAWTDRSDVTGPGWYKVGSTPTVKWKDLDTDVLADWFVP